MCCPEIYLYSAALSDIDDRAQDVLTSFLDHPELERAQRFRCNADRKAYVAGHALLRHALSKFENQPPQAWKFQAGTFGKPRLDPEFGRPDLSFSLSHTRGMVLVGIASELALGVDVERADPRKPHMEIAQRYFHPLEISGLRAAGGGGDRCTRFTALWTVKEAFLKALGTGLQQSLDSFAFDFEDTGRLFVQDPALGDAGDWLVYMRNFDDFYCACVARFDAPKEVRIVHTATLFDQQRGWQARQRYMEHRPASMA